ncbi:hypothetical protein EXS74_02555 [Candidatus Woesearchaeota archaeon]|nr:hypothetical protein [Candidatus Woesearchaeota archaeon]
MVAALTESLIILPAVGMGIILGAYELFLLKGDENFSGAHWFGHGLHIFPLIVVACLASFNIDFFQQSLGSSLPSILANDILLRVAIGLIMAIKVYAGSAVVPGAKGRGMHESLFHVLLIGALVSTSPYLWPLVEPFAPTWLGGSGS